MSEPVAGLPRVDRCVSAALLTAWIALKLGDRVSINAFDSKPRLASGLVSGSAAFAEIERVAAEIDYSGDETNYTFALTTLVREAHAPIDDHHLHRIHGLRSRPSSWSGQSSGWSRRIWCSSSSFATKSSKRLPRGVPRMQTTSRGRSPASSLLKERRVAITALQHLGVHVIESEYDHVSEQLVAGYLDLKQRTCCERAAFNTPMVNATRFRAAHEADWARLEDLVTIMEKNSIRRLSDDDLLALPALYRTTLSSLSVARDTSLDRALIQLSRAIVHAGLFPDLWRADAGGRQIHPLLCAAWPEAVRALWRETLICVVLTIAASIVAYMLIRSDPSWFYSVIPDGLAAGRDPSHPRSPFAPRSTTRTRNWLLTFATFLFTHNSQVAIFSFALGFAFAVPSVLLILYNGLMVGAFFAVFASKGLGPNLAAWLLIHGTDGDFRDLHIGRGRDPHRHGRSLPRSDIADGGCSSGGPSGGDCHDRRVLMLAVAGILEGVGRQTILNDGLRALIGAAMLASWLVYFYVWPTWRAATVAASFALQDRFRRTFVTPEGVDLKLELASAAQPGGRIHDRCDHDDHPAGRGDAGVGLDRCAGHRQFLSILWLLGFFILRNGWFSLFEMGSRGATPGKRICSACGSSPATAPADRGGRRCPQCDARDRSFPSAVVPGGPRGGRRCRYVPCHLLARCGAAFSFSSRCSTRIVCASATWSPAHGSLAWRRRRFRRDLVSPSAAVRARTFSDAALSLYGIYELQTLEDVLRL